MKTRSLLGFAFAQCAVFALGLISAAAAGSEVIMFQESGEASSDNMQQLIGHWRKTTIVFESPKDEHLVLHAVTGGKLVVTQTGICGFGHNVSAEGTYKKFHLQSRNSNRLKLLPLHLAVALP